MTATSNKTPREGKAGTAFRAAYEQRMEQIADMPVKRALRLELAYRCPICRVVHPGLRYNQDNSREFARPRAIPNDRGVRGKMSRLTPERLREIDHDYQRWKGLIDNRRRPFERTNDQFALAAIRHIGVLISALKQVRDERDGYAAALQSANQVVTRFGGWLDRWSLPGREKKTSDVYGAWDRVREEAKWGDPVGNPLDPAECLKARDAEVIEAFKSQIMQDVRGILDSAGEKQ